ncbi:MAG TPA: ketopantoate reductase C-terminal domain-containing protein, partial [Spirochaetia bacterium]|nr:ketopantoate reductase C-terminal domain-containing protein [Spirochaetia bacterium]
PRCPQITVRIGMPGGWLSAPGVTCVGPAGAPSSPDAVLVTMGRHHLHVMRRPDFVRLSGGGESPVCFLNADPEDVERLAVTPQGRGRGLTLLNAVKLQDAAVELGPGKAVLLFERVKPLDRVFRDLAGHGIACTTVEDARPFLHALLLWQLLWLPVAMCNTTLPVFLSFAEGRELAAGILSEGFQAMEKAGLELAPLPLMDPRELAVRLEKRPESFAADVEEPDRGYNSLLQSYLAGKPNEAPRLNRRIVEIGSAAGLHLTWNWRILQKVSRVSGLGFYRTPADLLRSLA